MNRIARRTFACALPLVCAAAVAFGQSPAPAPSPSPSPSAPAAQPSGMAQQPNPPDAAAQPAQQPPPGADAAQRPQQPEQPQQPQQPAAGGSAAPGGPSAAPGAGAAATAAHGQAVAAYNEGIAALRTRDVPGAIAKFEQASQLDPQLAAAPAVLADLYLSQHKPAEALAAADRALALEPGKPHLMFDRYQALKGLGDKPRAAQALEALAASKPAPDMARDVAVSYYNEAADAAKDQKADAAIADLKRATEVDRTLEPAYQALANVYVASSSFHDALEVADRWVAAEPQSLAALQLRHDMLLKLKDPRVKEARAALDSAKSAAAVPINQGTELYYANRIAEATRVLASLVQADPNNARAHYLLGLCYANAGDSAHARAELQAVIKLEPNDPDAALSQQMLAELR